MEGRIIISLSIVIINNWKYYTTTETKVHTLSKHRKHIKDINGTRTGGESVVKQEAIWSEEATTGQQRSQPISCTHKYILNTSQIYRPQRHKREYGRLLLPIL